MLRFPDLSGVADVAQGGTGQPSLTSNAVLLGNGTSPVAQVAPGSAGQVLTIDANGNPVWITPQGGGGGGTTVTAGQITVQNTSGGTVGSLVATIPCTAITATSVIVVTPEANSNSASGVEYLAQIPANARSAGTGFTVTLHRATPSGSASFVNNEGCTLNWMVIG